MRPLTRAVWYLRASASLAMIERLLRRVSVCSACRVLGLTTPTGPDASRTPTEAELGPSLAAVEWLERRRGGRLPCLPRALLLGTLLQRCRPRLRFGFQLRPSAEGHAWLQAGQLDLGRGDAVALRAKR